MQSRPVEAAVIDQYELTATLDRIEDGPTPLEDWDERAFISIQGDDDAQARAGWVCLI